MQISNIEDVRASLRLPREAPLESISIVNTGNSFLLVPLKDAASVSSVQPDQALVRAVSDQYDLIGYYVFTTETTLTGRHAAARMFAPRYGINEESATGMAAGPLACYLYDHLGIKEEAIVIEQGRLMQPPSPSVINVNLRLDGGLITSLMAGGRGHSTRTMEIEV